MVAEISNVKPLPQETRTNQELIEIAINLGCAQVKVIPVRSISLGNWVRLQCQYGCSHFGQRFTCPTFSPTCEEMAEILLDYRKALLLESDHPANVHPVVLRLENEFKQKGFHKAFGLTALPCNLCEVCTIDTQCRYPEKARPTLQACGIDVSKTLMNIGWDYPVQFTPCSEKHSIGMVLID